MDISKCVFPVSTLFRFIHKCMSMRRYSAAGLYTTMGRYWLFPSIAIEKSDMAFNKFEWFPISVNMLSISPTSLGRDVCVVWTGRRDEVNTRDAIGFHSAILYTYCGICTQVRCLWVAVCLVTKLVLLYVTCIMCFVYQLVLTRTRRGRPTTRS